MFQRFIEHQLSRARACPHAEMLGDTVFEELEAFLKQTTGFVAGSTATHLISQAAYAENPLAATLPDLLTEEERERALADVQHQLDSGAMSLPEPLVECLETQLANVTSAFLEALDRLVENRDAICGALLEGRRFQSIDDIGLSAGDTHNCGRSVMIFSTDAGKLVYKPHDLLADEQLRSFAERFYSDFVGIPRAISFGDQWGVCEFIEKRRAEGPEEAERFWHSLGGLTAFAKLLGSTDLHYQNILCHGTKPYIIDLETMFSPLSPEASAYAQHSEARECQLRSPAPSLIMPSRIEDMELSVLTNTEESGIAPIVDGEAVTVLPYLQAFKEGYRSAYRRTVEHSGEIREAVLAFPADMTVRMVLRATRGYWEILKKLRHHSALASAESWQRTMETLERLLRQSSALEETAVINSEIRQLARGDVPYFYTHLDSLSLYGEGQELVHDRFSTSARGHMLDTLRAMGEVDESFDLSYIENAVLRYPQKAETQLKGTPVQPASPHREAASPLLSKEDAAAEARRVLEEMHTLGIQTPHGQLVWGYVSSNSKSFAFSGPGLFDGLTGLAVFASAVAAVWPESPIKEQADVLIGEAVDEIQELCRNLETYEDNPRTSLPVGEGAGLGGILKGIALIRRCTPDESLEALCAQLLAFLERTDFSGCTEPDRIGGLAGLVSVLCRFEEYQGCTTAIRNAADRLLELKVLSYKDHVLWKTMVGVPRALSGAGHGMAGIAEALFSASRILDDTRYLPAAAEALDYELSAHQRYAHKFGTWADLRDFPPTRYMHGYCAGAPGTGIMLQRIMGTGAGGDVARILAGKVRESVDKLPLNPYDHLCCGNAAVAEYYLSAGDVDAAGRVLGAMYERKKREGNYRDSFSDGRDRLTASLFNGLGGIGYEMLRYAFPQIVPSIL